ncbi:MAG: DegT/DnrJ/EryC1/StrS family aminotransferase [Bacteroidota bacterium]|nr:DegT/DnrJ/EryC1/StrS family aminotransferase [Bacteroidota bacterium]
MTIQMVDLVTQYKKLKPEIDAAVSKVLESGQFILGKDVAEFESAAARYVGVKHAIGCASGTDALQIAIMALGLKPGDEIITTPFTFFATAEAAALIGIIPVFVDISEKTYNMRADLIEAAITSKTKAIMPVHLFGQPADLDEILDIARRRHLFVIEDNAQAMGALYHGKKAGSFGDLSCTSFFPSKNLGAYGDAGMIMTNDAVLAENARMIAQHGSRVRYKHELLGVNSRLDTIQAAILNVKLNYLDHWNAARQRNAALYNKMLDAEGIVKPFVAQERSHIYHQYSIRVGRRDALQEHLRAKGIPSAIHYPIPLHRQEAFGKIPGFVERNKSFPVAEHIAKEIISLPMHPELSEEQITFIAETVSRFYA